MEHIICHNLISFLPLSQEEYILHTPEDGTALDVRALIDKRNRVGCKYIVIACDNKYALKTFAGVRGEHGGFFEEFHREDAEGKAAYSKAELIRLLEENHITEYEFFYPYPNYQLPLAIYSDAYLPKVGELTNNLRNFQVDRAMLFDETAAWDHVIRDGLFTTFTNSFLLVIGPDVVWPNGEVIFTKFSNDRNPMYNIRTDIVMEDVDMAVVKQAMNADAISHIKNLQTNYEKLKTAYPQLAFDHCELQGDAARLEYLHGKTLDEILLGLLHNGDREGFLAMVKEYIQRVSTNLKTNVIDVDMIFKNIIVSDDGLWTVLDYEWTFDKAAGEDNFVRQLSVEFVIYRALYYFIVDNRLKEEEAQELYQLMALSEEQRESFQNLEIQFQEYVSLGHMTLGQLYAQQGGKVYPVLERLDEQIRQQQIMIKLRTLNGTISNVTPVYHAVMEDLHELEIEVYEDTQEIEVILGHCNMIADFIKVELNGCDVRNEIMTNGYHIYKDLYLYGGANPEPQIVLPVNGTSGKLSLNVTMKSQGQFTSVTFETLCYYLMQKDYENTFRGKIKKILKRGKNEH